MNKYAIMAIATLSWSCVSTATAGQITNVQLYDGLSASPMATIFYTNSDGTGSNSTSIYTDPQVSYGTTAPLFYCVDLWHENDQGATCTINQVSSMSFSNSTFSDADNRIGWLLAQDQSSIDARAAVQLAIWYTIDNKPGPGANPFSMSIGDPTITADYNTLIAFGGYNPSTNYSADFWQATHDPSNTLYQDMVSAGGGIVQLAAVAEPASLVQAAIGMVVLLGGVPLMRRWARKNRVAPGPAR